jgi:5-formyltetrahydrofolate cyclo-ligase
MPKNILRQKLRKLLQQISDEQRSEKSRMACLNLISTLQFKDAKVIMFFLSLPEEVDTTDAMQFAFQQGKTVAVPKVFWKEKYMLPVKIKSLDDEFTTEFASLRNPVTNDYVGVEQIDLVVTPALGFDLKGHRVGRSGGFYDRFFANERLRAVKCGFGFEEQLLDEIFVPAVSTDIPLDFLVTDEKVIYFNDGSP